MDEKALEAANKAFHAAYDGFRSSFDVSIRKACEAYDAARVQPVDLDALAVHWTPYPGERTEAYVARVKDGVSAFLAARAQPIQLPTRYQLSSRLRLAWEASAEDNRFDAMADYVLSLLAQRPAPEQPRAWTRELQGLVAKWRESARVERYWELKRAADDLEAVLLTPVAAPEQSADFESMYMQELRARRNVVAELAAARSQLADAWKRVEGLQQERTRANNATEKAEAECAQLKAELSAEREAVEAYRVRYTALEKEALHVMPGVVAALKAEHPNPARAADRFRSVNPDPGYEHKIVCPCGGWWQWTGSSGGDAEDGWCNEHLPHLVAHPVSQAEQPKPTALKLDPDRNKGRSCGRCGANMEAPGSRYSHECPALEQPKHVNIEVDGGGSLTDLGNGVEVVRKGPPSMRVSSFETVDEVDPDQAAPAHQPKPDPHAGKSEGVRAQPACAHDWQLTYAYATAAHTTHRYQCVKCPGTRTSYGAPLGLEPTIAELAAELARVKAAVRELATQAIGPMSEDFDRVIAALEGT